MEHLELISLCSIGYLMEAITNYDYIKERSVMFRCTKCGSAYCSNDCDYEKGFIEETEYSMYYYLDKEPPIECPGDYRCECDYESEDKE